MSDDASKFDPRFDPAFQRGYDGPVRTAPQNRQPARRSQGENPPQPIIGAPPQFRATERRDAFDGTISQATPASPGAGSDVAEPLEEDSPRRLNPFLLVLTVVGLVVIGLSCSLIANVDSLIQSSMDANSGYLFQMIWFGAPMGVGLGLATLIGVLFVLAARWRPRR